MKKLLLNLSATAISIFIVSNLIDGITVGSFKNLILISILLGFLNFFIKPVITLLTLPVNILTLGLFSFIINASILKIAFYLVEGANINNIITSIIAAILLSVVNCIVGFILK